ncbi:MAG TPA: PASTA domain-containing protein [Acidimicrobiales bacterium]|nr:PASTA domain-containing protein [Acidimicrobiales bacterium]
MTALFAFTAILILVVSRFYFGRTVRELGKAGRQATRVAVVTTGLGLLFALVLAVVHITGITVGSSAPPTTSAQTTGAQTTAVPTTSPRPGPVVTKTSVPSLVGMTEGEMTAALLQRRLVVAPFFVAVSNVPAGLVATQYPAANTRVPVHSVVTVDLSEANVIPVTG